jgi:hypothetical protein
MLYITLVKKVPFLLFHVSTLYNILCEHNFLTARCRPNLYPICTDLHQICYQKCLKTPDLFFFYIKIQSGYAEHLVWRKSYHFLFGCLMPNAVLSRRGGGGAGVTSFAPDLLIVINKTE